MPPPGTPHLVERGAALRARSVPELKGLADQAPPSPEGGPSSDRGCCLKPSEGCRRYVARRCRPDPARIKTRETGLLRKIGPAATVVPSWQSSTIETHWSGTPEHNREPHGPKSRAREKPLEARFNRAVCIGAGSGGRRHCRGAQARIASSTPRSTGRNATWHALFQPSRSGRGSAAPNLPRAGRPRSLSGRSPTWCPTPHPGPS